MKANATPNASPDTTKSFLQRRWVSLLALLRRPRFLLHVIPAGISWPRCVMFLGGRPRERRCRRSRVLSWQHRFSLIALFLRFDGERWARHARHGQNNLRTRGLDLFPVSPQLFSLCEGPYVPPYSPGPSIPLAVRASGELCGPTFSRLCGAHIRVCLPPNQLAIGQPAVASPSSEQGVLAKTSFFRHTFFSRKKKKTQDRTGDPPGKRRRLHSLVAHGQRDGGRGG